MATEEFFPVVDESGAVVGRETRRTCHSGTFLLHPVVHLHVVNPDGALYLQKRSMRKDIQPGKWDTAVGGHVDYGESIGEALRREAREEIGIAGFEARLVLKYVFESAVERELVHTHVTVFDGPISPDLDEVTEGRFWTMDEVEANIGKGIFTPNFEQEFLRLRAISAFEVG